MKDLLKALLMIAMVPGCGQPSFGAQWAGNLDGEKRDAVGELPFNIEPDRKREGDIAVPDGRFRIYPNTRFCVLGFVDKDLEIAIASLVAPGLNPKISIKAGPTPSALAKHGISSGTLESPGSSRVFMSDASDKRVMSYWLKDCVNNNINIILTQHASMNTKWAPYKLVITARQGRKFWTRSVERLEYGGKKLIVPGRYGYDPGKEWDPDLDAQKLNSAFEEILLQGDAK